MLTFECVRKNVLVEHLLVSSLFLFSGTTYHDPASPLLNVTNALPCETYAGAGSVARIRQVISNVKLSASSIDFALYMSPDVPQGSNIVALQVPMLGSGAVLTGNVFLFSPSQVSWTVAVTCGPGTAPARPKCSPEPSGDLNGDGIVNAADLALLQDKWGLCSAPCPADLDCSGKVDYFDQIILLQKWTSQQP